MGESAFSVVTGAFGYTGKYIAQRLLDRGDAVRSLTRNPASFSPFGDRVERHPLDFDDTEQLARSLEGADTLFNTFWIRFSRGPVNHDLAVRNTMNLVDAAVSRPECGASCISASPAHPPIRLYPTSVGRARSRITSAAQGLDPLDHPARRSSLGSRTYSSTTSPGSCVGSRFSLSLAGVGIPLQPVFVDDVAQSRRRMRPTA